MFTGIIERQGVVESLQRNAKGGRIRVKAPNIARDLRVSASIAVNGCCLTVIESNADSFAADLSPETLARTSFAQIKPGMTVNLERPLSAGNELGGHIVQGHVDAVGKVVELKRQGENWWLGVKIPRDLAGFVAEKGSMTVDGISLTVAAWRKGVAGFAIIPYTYAQTNLRNLSKGDAVNLEADVIAKYVEQLLEVRGMLSPRPKSKPRAKKKR